MKEVTNECQLIVKHILKRADQYNLTQKHSNQISITISRIQSILYFSQIEYIKHNGSVMFEDDFYASEIGPEVKAVRELYMDYSTGKADTLAFPTGKLNPDKRKIIDINLNKIDEKEE